MALIFVLVTIACVVALYFKQNPMHHGSWFMFRRFLNWFPLGMTYAFLYMARYNISISKAALGSLMDKESFGLIFAAGTVTYGLSFLIVGPMVDKIGGRKGILISALGSAIVNTVMGLYVYLYLQHQVNFNMTLTLSILYSINMFFQSYGGVSINKVKAYWFHVRERGIFGGIFGTLISVGLYLAFDWGQAIADASKSQVQNPTGLQTFFNNTFGTWGRSTDSLWLIFYLPAAFLIFWAIIDYFLVMDSPAQAGLQDFDTADASSGEMHIELSIFTMLKRFFTSPILLMISFVEFTTGIARNGIVQWYFVFSKEVKQVGAEFFLEHWGLLLCLGGIVGGFAAGFCSDKFFGSRRGPPTVVAGLLIIFCLVAMLTCLDTAPIVVGCAAVMIGLLTITIHSLMSGTAASDFGGRKLSATASGITDGFVYLGSGVQSISLGYLVTHSWTYWPAFLLPFSILGFWFSCRMWHALPEATRKYMASIEKVTVTTNHSRITIKQTRISEGTI
jgi:MFS transporter, OPA family, glycerol-3-phosphate transporter